MVKAIDKTRFPVLYTTDNGTRLIKPEQHAKLLSIDEFKLHDDFRYETRIIDLKTGHVLWIQEGKKKQVVYDFIEHVEMDWIKR